MNFYLKDARGTEAGAIENKAATNILRRLRFQGRKLVEIYTVNENGQIDRFQERTRRRLGSNAIASRTWLVETLAGSDWADGRYVQEPREAIEEFDPVAVMLVLQGAEDLEEAITQLEAMAVAST